MLSTASSLVSRRNAHGSRRLLVRPRPIDGESKTGYLIRVARANGYEQPRQMQKVLRTIDGLCAALGLPVAEFSTLAGPYPSYWGANIFYGDLVVADFNHQLMRWCPLCLMESEHLRGPWILKLCCVCTVHSVPLHDCCPCCGEPQRLERSILAACGCGGKLAAARVVPANEGVMRVCRVLQEAVAGQTAADGLPALSAAEWIRLTRYLGQFSETFQPACPGQVANLHRVETATVVMQGISQLLDNWPANFHAVLRAIHRKQEVTPSLRRAFSPIYRVLYAELKAPCFQFLRDAFEAYVHENWWGLVCKRNRSLRRETVESHPRLTLRNAAGQAGASPALVRHFIQGELITGMESELPSGRHFRSLHQNEVQRIGALAQEAMTLSETADLLALPEWRLRTLVATGVLVPMVPRSRAKSATWLFSRASVLPLSRLTGTSQSESGVVLFKQILRNWRLRKGEFVAMVRAIESRELVLATPNPSPLGEVLFNREQVHTWLRALRISADEWFSVDQAARILGVKQEVAYGLVARGFLPSTPTPSTVRGISASNLKTFQENYVSLVEFARLQRHSPRWVLKAIRAKPVTGPSVDGLRQYFFCRAEVSAQLQPSETKESDCHGNAI